MNRIENLTKHAEISEKVIEKHLVERVKALGGLALKFASGTMIGYPDRLVLLPHGFTMWVELKSKGKKPRKLQIMRHAQLEALGNYVNVVDSIEGVDELLADTLNIMRRTYGTDCIGYEEAAK